MIGLQRNSSFSSSLPTQQAKIHKQTATMVITHTAS